MKGWQGHFVLVVLLSLSFVYLTFTPNEEKVNAELHETMVLLLERIKQQDNVFNESVVMFQSSIMNDFAVFSKIRKQEAALQASVGEVEAKMPPMMWHHIGHDVELLFQMLEKKSALMGLLKSQQDILLHSERSVPVATAAVITHLSLGNQARLYKVVADVYHHLALPAPELNAEIQQQMTGFIKDSFDSQDWAQLDEVFKHIRLILNMRQAVDALAKDILAIPVADLIEGMSESQRAMRVQHLEGHERLTVVLIVFALLLMVYILVIIYRQKRLSDELQAVVSELEYQKFAFDQHSIVAITDSGGRIIHANDLFCEVSQYSRDELMGQNHRILNSGYHPKAFFAEMWKTIGNGEVWKGEVRNKRKDGSCYWVDSSIVPFLNKAGKVERYVAIRTDITARKEAEEKNTFLARFPAENPAPIMRVDSNSVLLYANKASDILLQEWQVKVGDCLPQHLHATCLESLLGNQQKMVDVSCNDRNYELDFSSAEGVDDVSIYARDVTALREARDQALESSRMKSMFLSTVSHEIRTPMNGVIGMTDLLLDTSLDAEQHEFAKTTRASAQALLTIINDILDFSKIEAGHFHIDATGFSLLSVVEGAVGVLAVKARDKGLSLQSYVDPDLPACLIGDPGRLRQVLLNLTDNALKFTEHGDVQVRVSAAGLHDQQLRVKFEVRDSGIGLSEEAQARLFQPFVQADGTTTRKYGGTGLGLAICKRIVELMHGSIQLQSAPGEGSTFTFEISFPIDETMSEHEGGIDSAVLKGMNVLVVDEDPENSFILERYLNSWDMHVVSQVDANKALRLLKPSRNSVDAIQLVIMETSFSGLGGVELAAKMKSDVEIPKIPVILYAGSEQPGMRDAALKAGVSALLIRPVNISHLFDAVVTALGGHKQKSEPVSPERSERGEMRPDPMFAGMKVLLAEDNDVNQKVALAHLSKLGCLVSVVSNGEQACHAVNQEAFDIVFMDCQMPVMDGFSATKIIRERESGRHQLIVAMTANAMKGTRDECLAAGMDDYMTKPISREKIIEMMSKNVDEKALVVEKRPDHAVCINLEQLHELFGEDNAIICEILQLFQLSMRRIVNEHMAGAVRDRDAEVMYALAHELKGAAANVGGDNVAIVCLRIETQTEVADWDEIVAGVDQLGLYLLELEGLIESLGDK